MSKFEVMNINGIECFERDGIAYLKLETVARGLGFTRTADSGNEVVRWERVNAYLKDLNIPSCGGGAYIPEMDVPTSGHDGFIPESAFYRLAMKAKNETAEAFQNKIANEILPSIRKHGAYAVDELLDNPDFMIKALTALKDEREQRKALEKENARQQKTINEQNNIIDVLEPKARYTDTILNSSGLVTITQIAKDYGMGGAALNKKLAELHIQYKQGEQWLLYRKYHGKGYTHSRMVDIIRSNGRPDVVMQTNWTQKGRLFLYEELKKNGIVPVIEQDTTHKPSGTSSTH